ncbi:antitoxin [Saccharopolyspora halophila]
MGLENFKDKLSEHGDKVGEGVDKAADAAKEKFGHEDKIDQAKEKGKEFLGAGNDQQESGQQEEPGQQQ